MQNRRYFLCTLLIAFIIFIACLLMAGPMRAGLPVGGDLPTRLAYIQANLVVWQLGWLSWMISAVSLLLFAHLLATALTPSVWRQFALTLVGLGIIPDLSAETLYALALPMLAQQGSSLDTLQFIDQFAMLLTGFLGNGLYNLGGLLLTLLLLKQHQHLASWLYLGVLAWALGLGLSLAIALQQLALAEILTAVSMALSTLWFVLIAYQLWGKPNV